MTSICLICFRKDEEHVMNPFYEPFFENLSLSEILVSISSLKLEENNLSKICEDCSQVILNFNNLIKTYEERRINSNMNGEANKREDVFYMDEQDYDNYVECETESYEEVEKNIAAETANNDKVVSQWIPKEESNQEFPEVLPDVKEKPRVFDEFGNEEISCRKYSCNECGDSFLFKVGFSSHMTQKHSVYIQNDHYDQYSTEITVKMPPPTPDINFARKPPIKKSFKKRLDKTMGKCQICREILPSAEELKEHYNRHKTHICEHCGAAFLKNSYLRDHLLVHTTIKRYVCDLCGKKFKYRNGLAVHRNIHVNFRGFMCDTCGQGFNAKSTLKTHMKLKHSDERNWPCPDCDLTFKVKSWLDKHYSRKHTLNRTKDFVCNLCGIAYLNKTTLTRHISEKHTGTPVRHYCTVCDKSYSMKNKLNLHMQKKHNIIFNNSSSQML